MQFNAIQALPYRTIPDIAQADDSGVPDDQY